ncbi:MAG: UDP-2,3-diacylglucosamine diphosphatase [Woeseiaceae bacterium]|nr:UDP-2,3-diacylglucosamine diphosphatase [Woeseiaceae bacterium]
MTTLFISDLHLEGARPDIGAQFLSFLEGEARRAEALYILGDLFEYWVGDDDPDPHYDDCKRAMRALVDSGVSLYFMHGNRDFMIGENFASETGATILDDPSPLDLYGTSVLLSHGDAYCTDDVEYQKVRLMTRNPEWQQMMLAKPLEERIAIAKHAREQSMARGQAIDMDIMDVNDEAIRAAIVESGVDVLLHGHTHRPNVHDVDLGDRVAKRIVLGDWYEQGSVVRWDEDGPRLEVLPRH